ncbi:MAG: hypothetical protein ACT4OP_07595 [Actinomycetota bacterium]
MASVLVAVTVPQLGDARRRHWAKLVTAVDSSKSTGWAYLGEFVADGGLQDLPVGGLLLVYGERGGQANPQPEAALYSIGADASLLLGATASGRAWARTLRDRALELLELSTVEGPLAGVADQALADELRRRGWELTAPSD